MSSLSPPTTHAAHVGWERSSDFYEGAQRWHLIRNWLAGPWGRECGMDTRTVSDLGSGFSEVTFYTWEWPSLALPSHLAPFELHTHCFQNKSDQGKDLEQNLPISSLLAWVLTPGVPLSISSGASPSWLSSLSCSRWTWQSWVLCVLWRVAAVGCG